MAEHWQIGDVVRNADDPDDSRVWLYTDPVARHPWLAPSSVSSGAAWFGRAELPGDLRLLVRDGLPQPEVVTAPERKPFERYGPSVDALWQQACMHVADMHQPGEGEARRRRYRELLAQHGLLRRTGPGYETAARAGAVSVYLGVP